jgi:hypothetical protein
MRRVGTGRPTHYALFPSPLISRNQPFATTSRDRRHFRKPFGLWISTSRAVAEKHSNRQDSGARDGQVNAQSLRTAGGETSLALSTMHFITIKHNGS